MRSKIFSLAVAAGVFLVGVDLSVSRAEPAEKRRAVVSGAPLPLDLAFSARTIRRWLDQPSVSRDGKWIAYEVLAPPEKSPETQMEKGNRFLPSGTPSGCAGLRLYVAETATGKNRAICDKENNCWRPSFSPDGRKIAYYSDEGGLPQLWVYDLGTSQSKRVNEARIKAKHWPGDEAAWSPDGREVFVPVQLANHPVSAPPAAAARQHKEGAPAVTVYRSGSEEAAAAAGDGTPPGMMAHFLWENNSTLAAVDVDSGKLRVVVPADAEPRPSNLRLSPDGKWLSYLSVFRMKGETASDTYFDLAVVPASGGTVKVVESDVEMGDDDYFGATYRWRPGTSQIVFLKKKRLWLADAQSPAGTKPRALAEKLGDLTDLPILMTRDGKAVLVGIKAEGEKVYYRVPPKALALVPLDGSEPKVYSVEGTPIRADIHSLWQPDAGAFFLVRRDEKTAQRTVLRVDAATGKTSVAWTGRGRLEFVGAGSDGRWVIARYESLDTPPDYYRFDEKFSSRQRISRAEPRFENVAVGPLETFQTKVPGFDGRLLTVDSTIFLPRNRKAGEKLPTIVYFYAGSQMAETAHEFGGGAPNSIPVQIFTTRGYAVLLVDVPLGPEGVGGNPIQEMADAILPQVHEAAARGFTDIDRVAIMGQSYGGYGTAAMITQTNLFRAAIALDGLYDLGAGYARMDPGGSTFNFVWSETGQGRMGTHPWADLRRYLANSPYYLADKIHTPLLLIHGEKDDACPVEGAERMYNALKRLKRTAQLAVYAGEGHVPGTWSLVNAVDAGNRMTEFLEKYLLASGNSKGKEATAR
jgi:dipeptidyl aminopeptidase/acylaminoacyl peptidase